jgi:hypothetical protein
MGVKQHGAGIVPSLYLQPGAKDPRIALRRAAEKKETAGASVAPQVTRAGVAQQSRLVLPGMQCQEPGAGTHTKKWDDCVADVMKKGSADNAYAVCTAQLGPSKQAKQGGPGSGPKGSGSTVDKAISDYNDKVKQKLAKSTVKQSRGKFNFIGRIKEASTAVDGQVGRRFRVTLLQEGMGNLHDAYYYTASAIESAVPLFEGAQFYIDHPSEEEEVIRPERSVRDLGGYFEEVRAEPIQGQDNLGLTADLVFLADPSLNLFRTQMIESLNYSTKHPGEDLVGLSINAGGDFDTVPIQQFLEMESIPDSCKSKLLEATQEGVDVIRPVREMKSAFSCDLVTTAGAGGKVNQILEGGKMKMKQHKQAEGEAEDGIGNAGAASADGSADGQTGSHPDAAQDVALISNMLSKYLGDGFSDEDKQMMAEAYQNALEMGLEGKEAEDTAGHAMKMSKHMQAKQKQAAMHQAEGGEVEAEGEAESDADGDKTALGVHGSPTVPPAGSKNGMKPQDQIQQSHKQSAGRGNGVTALVAKMAKLESELERLQLEKHTDKVLRESGLPMKATKKFRESCLPAIRTVQQLERELRRFKEAYTLGSESEGEGFVLGVEPNGAMLESGVSRGFGDCIDGD